MEINIPLISHKNVVIAEKDSHSWEPALIISPFFRQQHAKNDKTFSNQLRYLRKFLTNNFSHFNTSRKYTEYTTYHQPYQSLAPGSSACGTTNIATFFR